MFYSSWCEAYPEEDYKCDLEVDSVKNNTLTRLLLHANRENSAFAQGSNRRPRRSDGGKQEYFPSSPTSASPGRRMDGRFARTKPSKPLRHKSVILVLVGYSRVSCTPVVSRHRAGARSPIRGRTLCPLGGTLECCFHGLASGSSMVCLEWSGGKHCCLVPPRKIQTALQVQTPSSACG